MDRCWKPSLRPLGELSGGPCLGSRVIRKSLIFSSSLIFCFGLIVVSDRVVGMFVAHREPGLVFPSNARYHFQTPEFSFNLEINSLGFRDREFSIRRTAKTRILALGDSFTYGWGVEASQSWPKLVESNLRATGHDVEIANLGKPGGSPRNYADIAEKATPALKPDLLIIVVLQGDDLAQMEQSIQAGDQNQTPANSGAVRRSLRRVTDWLYPNFLALLNESAEPPALSFQWKEDAKSLLAAMTPESKLRFEHLDKEIKQVFMNGDLNPALVYLGVAKPDYFLQTLDGNSPKVKLLISEMAKQFARIKAVASHNKADVIVISVPYGIYVSPSSFKTRQRLGFSTAPEMLTNDAEDEAIRTASQMAGIPFYDLTRQFRKLSATTDLFFTLDGHFNSAGHKYFADNLTLILQDKIP